MDDFSVLIGGKAGFGIDKAGLIIARLLNRLSYRLYIYRDYPSIIRGGHTFSIVRASREKISTHLDKVDFILALNQETVDFHEDRLKGNSVIVFDSDSVKLGNIPPEIKSAGIPIGKIIKEENASEIMRNTCIIGAFAKITGIKSTVLDDVLKKEITRELEQNVRIAHRGYEAAQEAVKIEPLQQSSLPLISGNQAVGLGLIKGGLKTYIAYPMTPSSPVLHFLADIAKDFGLKVIHPESEIGVILMALGFSYMGERVAVGTSGGGFCLMTEALSLSGMSELPIVIMMGQRPGPSTGLPTYSSQTDLHFVLNAGQGEFCRFVVAPGDPEEAYFWSAKALGLSWKYQIPSIILSDKNLGEGVFSFDLDSIGEIKEDGKLLWDWKPPYKRYLNAENGISPLAFPPDKEAIIKVNSYEHDEFGITTEDPLITKKMQEKRLRKIKYLLNELENYEAVKVYGKKSSSVAVLCWGSNKGVVSEAAKNLGLKVIQPVVLSPFSVRQFQDALKGVKRLICVENNALGQLARLIKLYGFKVEEKVLKYDGRPFSLNELQEQLGRLI